MANQYRKGLDGSIKLKHQNREVDQRDQAVKDQLGRHKVKIDTDHANFVHNMTLVTVYEVINAGYDMV